MYEFLCPFQRLISGRDKEPRWGLIPQIILVSPDRLRTFWFIDPRVALITRPEGKVAARLCECSLLSKGLIPHLPHCQHTLVSVWPPRESCQCPFLFVSAVSSPEETCLCHPFPGTTHAIRQEWQGREGCGSKKWGLLVEKRWYLGKRFGAGPGTG